MKMVPRRLVSADEFAKVSMPMFHSTEERRKSLTNSRKGFENFKLQAGGHTQLVSVGSGLVSKPVNEREAKFYKQKCKLIEPFLPRFEGIITLPHHASLVPENCENTDPLLPNRFIVLEDLSARFKRPCVLDLKMGTRVHGDFASPQKAESQKRKCLETTSTRLGARICGTIWHNPYESVSYKTDKYDGRRLDVDGFESRLLHFFSDGKKLRKNIVREMLEKLSILRETIIAMKTYRFYSCSLLVLYEGLHKDSLITTDRLRHLSKRDSFGEEELEDYEDLTQPPTKEDLVTVKIIDFAHATFEGFLDDPIVHEGPDTGFLKGLDTLTDILSTALTGS